MKLLLPVILVVIIAGIFLFFFKPANKPDLQVIPNKVTVTPPPSPWKTYKNDQYDFEITYPRIGVVVNKDGSSEGECGQAIRQEDKYPVDIQVDNFFNIKIIDFKGSIEEYLKSQRAANIYETQELASGSATQALAIGNLKKGVEYARGLPPLVYTKALFKKGDNIFVVKATQFPNNFGGCIAPDMADPVKYPEIAKIKWDISKSIKFE